MIRDYVAEGYFDDDDDDDIEADPAMELTFHRGRDWINRSTRRRPVTWREINARIDKFQHMLMTGFPKKLTPVQKRIINMFIRVLARFVAGPAWAVHGKRVMQHRRWSDAEVLTRGALVMMMRRGGKSTAVARVLAACAVHVKGIVFSVISTGERASNHLRSMWLDELAASGCSVQWLRRSQEEMSVLHQDTNEVTKFFFYPASSNFLRGKESHVTVLEEAAYIKPALIYSFVLPLLVNERRVILGISTPAGPENYFTKFFQLANQQRSTFRVYHVQLCCDRCRERGQEIKCRHRLHLQPPWKSVESFEENAVLFADQVELFKQEEMGMIGGTGKPAFPADAVTRFMNADAYRPPGPEHDFRPPFILIACDPCGSGDPAMQRSEMALTAVFYWQGQAVVQYPHAPSLQ